MSSSSSCQETKCKKAQNQSWCIVTTSSVITTIFTHPGQPGRRKRHQRAAPWASPPGRRSTGSCSTQGGSNCFASWCRSSEKDCGEELITLIMMLLMLMMTKLLTWILATHIMRSPVRAPPPRANKRVTRIASICLRVNRRLLCSGLRRALWCVWQLVLETFSKSSSERVPSECKHCRLTSDIFTKECFTSRQPQYIQFGGWLKISCWISL